jgi:dTDP-4-dehydrorhamnose 3,5-epimerase
MEILSLPFDGVKLINLKQHIDNRGLFSEIFSEKLQSLLNIKSPLSQVNFSHSLLKGTIRGLHYQVPPAQQGKLIWVVQGDILNVILDVRLNSDTFGQHIKVNVSDSLQVLYLPPGFANGFCTLKPDTKVCYMTTAPYSRAHERGILWNDPELAIEWPISDERAIVSPKDQINSSLKNMDKDNLL